jgi:hypothetical protein
MNNVETEQVEVTKLLGVTRDYKLSWSKYIDTTVAKMGRSLSIIKCCSDFLTTISPGLQVSRVVRCHKEGLGEIAVGSEQGSMAGP